MSITFDVSDLGLTSRARNLPCVGRHTVDRMRLLQGIRCALGNIQEPIQTFIVKEPYATTVKYKFGCLAEIIIARTD